MKKLLAMTFFILTLMMTAMPAWADTSLPENSDVVEKGAVVDAEETKLTIVCDGKKLVCENEAIRILDMTYLPLREVMEFYGVTLGWATGEAEDKVILNTARERYQLVLDLENAAAYGSDDAAYPLKHENSIVYLPIHFYYNVLNAEMNWDDASSTLTLDTTKKKKNSWVTTPGSGSVWFKPLLNLPLYEQTTGVSRNSGLASRVMGSNGELTVYEEGIASYYGGKFHGRKTASGTIYNQYEMTAAHKTLPFGTVVRVTALWNGLSVDVTITDRGPFTKGRIIDLSTAAAGKLEMHGKGIGPVSIAIVSYPENAAV